MLSRSLSLVLLSFISLTASGEAFDFEDLRRLAQELAAKPFRTATNQVPESLSALSYVEHQKIRFIPEQALWRDEQAPFIIEFGHPGYVHKDRVSIHTIEDGASGMVPFKEDYFDYGGKTLQLPDDLGFAGFRILYTKNNFGEVAAFGGASYFRMIGHGQTYGTSARGLALNTTSTEGEEFPVFRQFWIQKPKANAKAITLYALMDSPSVAGAYQFMIRPGSNTVAEVSASLFPRCEAREFGLAALTSMFLHGKNGRPVFTDFRPEVHDADGFLLYTSRDEWIWHSLEAGKMLRVNVFSDDNPQGFGLMQRERRRENYEDLVAHYERRPSVWVKPKGRWGKGGVQLVQIPSDKEFNDNIVAYWVPAVPPKPGEVLNLEYELHWTRADPVPQKLASVSATRIGRVIVEPPKVPANLRFVIDFDFKKAWQHPLKADIHLSEGVQMVTHDLIGNEERRTMRMVIEVADPQKSFDLRARILEGEEPVTETWTFTWQP